MRNISLAIGVFIVLLIALSFGERLGADLLNWLYTLFIWASQHLQEFTQHIQQYITKNWGKVAIALLLTVPICYWISRKSQDPEKTKANHNKRKTAIFLAIFTGWLGLHRFYLGQIGWGLLYIFIFYLFAPLAILLGWIDAVRYVLMNDDDFKIRM